MSELTLKWNDHGKSSCLPEDINLSRLTHFSLNSKDQEMQQDKKMFSETEVSTLMNNARYALANSPAALSHDVKSNFELLSKLIPEPGKACFGSGDIASKDAPLIQKFAGRLFEAIKDAQAKGTIRLPKNSVNFGADVSMTQSPTDAGSLSPKPITIVARTGGIACQAFWGRCVHDMNGFIPPDGPVILDWNHDPDTVVGVADSVSVVDGQLVANGRLTPFTTGDKADEIVFQGSKGVPFQASVTMDQSTLETQQVPDGQTVNVNGNDFEGPVTVFTKWAISGIAILPYGADSTTSVQFARSKPSAIDSMKKLTREVAATWKQKA